MRNTRFTILRPATWTFFIWFTVILRLIAAGTILFQPLYGMLASFFMDWFDAYLLIQRAGISREAYHTLDKNLDEVWALVMLAVGLATPYRIILTILFLFRLIGHGIYLMTNDTRVFLFFPNVFEFAFFWFVALAPWVGTYSVSRFMETLLILTVLKVIQELSLHWIWPARLRYMKKHWHGYSPFLRFFGWHRLGL